MTPPQILRRRISPASFLPVTCAWVAALAANAFAQETFTLNADGPSGGGAITHLWRTAGWLPAGEYPGQDDLNDIATVNFREFNNVDGTGDPAPTLDLEGMSFSLSTLNVTESGTGNTDGNFANGTLTLSNLNYTSGGREIDFETTTTVTGVNGSLAINATGNNFDFLGPVNAATSISFSNGTTQFIRFSRTTTGSFGAVTQNAAAAFVIQNFDSSATGIAAGLDTFTFGSLNVTNTGKIEVDRVSGTAGYNLTITGGTTINSSRLRFDANDDNAVFNLQGLVAIDNNGAGVEIGTEDQVATLNINAGIADGGDNDVLTFNVHGIASSPFDFGTVNINNLASTRTAATNIGSGRVNLNVDNGLGTGQVTVRANGYLNLAVAQTALDIDIAEFGAIGGNLTGAAYGTNLTIAPQNVIFAQTATVLPTTTQTGGAVHFVGITSNNAVVTVGDDGNAGTTDDIYKGVAFGSHLATGDFGGTVNEAQAGQGILVYLLSGKRFGGTTGTATFNTTGGLNVTGPGTMEINEPDAAGTQRAISLDSFTRAGTASTQNNTIVRIGDASALGTGQTLNVTDGRVDLDAVNAVQAGGIVNLNSGATLSLDQSVSTGTFNLNQGSAVSVTSTAQLTSGATFNVVGTDAILIIDADFSIAAGSNFETLMRQMNVVLHDSDADDIDGAGIVLGNGKRFATPSTQSVDLTGGAGISAEAGATNVIFSASSGDTLDINDAVNLAGVSLQIGDTTGFTTIVSGGTGGTNFTRAILDAQTGTVALNATTTRSIDVQSGLLRFEQGAIAGLKSGTITTAVAGIGGATTIGPSATVEIEYNQETDPAGIQIDEVFFVPDSHSAANSGGRTFIIDRNTTVTGGTDRIDLNNVVLGNGAAIGIDVQDVSATNARMSVALEGTATAARQFGALGAQDDFSFNAIRGVNADGSVNTTDPRVLNLGFAAATTIGTTNIYGAVSPNVQINMDRSHLTFNAGSTLNGSTVRNNSTLANIFQNLVLNNNPGAGTIVLDGNGTLELRNGVTGDVVNNYAGLVVNSGANRGGVTAYVNEVASGAPLVNVIEATINFTDASNALAGDRAVDSTVTGGVTFTNVNLAGALDLQGRNGTQLNVGTLTLTGAASLTNHNSTNIATISGGAHALAIGGGTRTQVTGNLTAGSVVIDGSPTAGLEFSPGTGNTSTVAAASIQVNSLLAARTGTTDLGATVVASAPVGSIVAGLREGRLTGTSDLNLATPNPNNSGIQLSPRLANYNVPVTSSTPWGQNETWIYNGQIFDADGIFSFIEHVDDDVEIKINGTQVLLNMGTVAGGSSASTITASGSPNGLNTSGAAIPGGNQSAGAGTINFGPDADGWYDIEIRLQNGTGVGGPTVSQGFNTLFGLGFSPSGAVTTNPNDYIRFADSGLQNILRTDTLTKGNVAVDGGATLNAGGFAGIGRLTMAGADIATVNVSGSGASDADMVEVTGSVTGNLNVAAVAASLTTQALNVDAGAILNFDGNGRLVVNGLGTGNGLLNVNGGILSGAGQVGAVVSLNLDGVIAPGNSPGILSTAGAVLNGGTLAFEIFGADVGTGYDQLNVAGTVNLLSNTPFTLAFGFAPAIGTEFVLVNNDLTDAISGLGRLVFNNVALDESDTFATPEGYEFSISYAGGTDTNDVVLTTLVPEPASAMTLLVGLGVLAGSRRASRRR